MINVSMVWGILGFELQNKTIFILKRESINFPDFAFQLNNPLIIEVSDYILHQQDLQCLKIRQK